MSVARALVPAAVALLLTAVAVLSRPALLVDLDRAAHDAFVRQTAPPAIGPRVAIVVVDEASLAAHGQWPWPRSTVARLVESLHDAGAAAIGFDILFSEPDRLGQTSPGSDPTTSTDRALAAALSSARVAAGFALTFDPLAPGQPATPCILHPLEPVVLQRGDVSPAAALFAGTSAVCSVPALGRAAAASGAINVSPDSDGVLRRVPLLVTLGGRVYPSLGLAAVHLADPRPLTLEAADDGALRLRRGDEVLQLDAKGQLAVRLRGPGRTFPHVSAADVMAGRVGRGTLEGRVVLVGATALGVRDVVATALDPRFPGVEVHATVADTLLGTGASARPEFADLLDLAGALLGALAAVALVLWLGPVRGTAATLVAAVAAWFGARALYAAGGTVVSPIGVLLGLAVGAATAVATQLVIERRRADGEVRRRHQAQKLIVQTLTTLTATRDADTGRHARRTQEYVRLLASTLAENPSYRGVLTPDRIDLIATLAPLHDIGKVGISDAVLNKPGHLTDAEYTEMKSHAALGHESLLRAEHLAGVHDNEVISLAKDIVYTHHERWDGSGYPRGLRATAIPLAGRLVAVVDVYDALVEARAYKPAMEPGRAREIIAAGRGTHFDPEIVDAFLRCFDRMQVLRPSLEAAT
jgi:CHASE2 domain-containing sensor protein